MTTFQKAELLKRMQRMDHEMRTRHYPSVLDARDEELPQERDAAEYFAVEQCPADSNFR